MTLLFLLPGFLLSLLVPLGIEAREPTIAQVQEEALRYLGYNPREIASWKSRAGWAAALPRLQVGFDRDLKEVTRLNTSDTVSISGGEVTIGPDQNDFDENFDQGTRFEAKAVWYLDQLVFNRDSLAVSAEHRDWIRERQRALEEVTEAYFTRQRLLEAGRRRGPGGGAPVGGILFEERFLLDRATARLDSYTGGWFSDQLAR